MAFAPQLLKASSAAVGLGSAIDKAIGDQAVANIVSLVSNLNRVEETIKRTAAPMELLRAEVTLARKELDKYVSFTQESVTAANQLLAVEKLLTAEKKAQSTLLASIDPNAARKTAIQQRIARIRRGEEGGTETFRESITRQAAIREAGSRALYMRAEGRTAIAEQSAAAAEAALQIEKLNDRQRDFIARTNEAAQAASRQTAEFLRQQRIAKQVAALNLAAPAAQLMLPAAAPGSPAMSGGARRRITGPIERLGGARTLDEAQATLRLAQANTQLAQSTKKVDAEFNRFLPDTNLLNATARGIQRIQTNQEAFNESIARGIRFQEKLNREQERQRRLGIGVPSTTMPGTTRRTVGPFPVEGPMPLSSLGRGAGKAAATTAKGAGSLSAGIANAILGAGFPMLFGGGIGAVAGGGLGGLIGGGALGGPFGMALSVGLSAIGQQFDNLTQASATLGQALTNPIKNFSVLKEQFVISTREQEKYVDILIESGDYTKAYSIIQQELIDTIGVDGVNKIKKLDSASDAYNRKVAELTLKLQALIAEPMTKFIVLVTELLSRLGRNITLPGKEKTLPADKRQEIQQRREAILARARKPVLFGGATPAEMAAEMDAIARDIERYSTTPPPKQLQRWTAEFIQQQKMLRDVYVERYKLQTDKEGALLQLSGTVRQEDLKTLELQRDKLKVNEELYASQQQLRDIELAGGIAKGVATKEEVDTLKNTITKLQTEKIEIDVQIKQDALKKIEEDINRAAKAATHSIDMQVVAARGQQTIQQSQYDLMRSMNDLQLQRIGFEEQLLNNAFEQTTNFSEQLAILDRLAELVQYRYELNVANANVERLSTIAQIKGTTDLLALEIQRQRIEYQSTVAFVAKQNAMGIYNQEQQKALTAQGNALDIAVSTYDYAVRNAVVQERIANAVYDQKVEAAGFARNMELASLASRRAGLNGGDNREAGMGLGQRFVMGRTYQGGSFEVSNSSLKKMAKGGYVTSPTMALIGEGGEPEFVVPQSKAMAFAENWMNGRRGADALPRLATVSSSPQPTINITTGPVMQQNGTTYVTLADMEQAMQTMASNMLGSNRSYSGRRYQGVS